MWLVLVATTGCRQLFGIDTATATPPSAQNADSAGAGGGGLGVVLTFGAVQAAR